MNMTFSRSFFSLSLSSLSFLLMNADLGPFFLSRESKREEEKKEIYIFMRLMYITEHLALIVCSSSDICM